MGPTVTSVVPASPQAAASTDEKQAALAPTATAPLPGQREPHARALTGRAVDADAPAVCLHDPRSDGQSQPGTAGDAVARLFAAVESFKNVRQVVGLDTLVALMAGLAIFPIVFANGLMPSAGPGLVFTTLPIAFGKMPGGQVIGVLFFVMLVVAVACLRRSSRAHCGNTC